MEDLKKKPREIKVDMVVLPNCLEAERGIIGAVIFENKIYDMVSDILRTDHFYSMEHAKIWDFISSKIEKSEKINYIGISQFFKDDTDIQRIGGAEYFIDLIQSVIAPEINARYYGELIIDSSNKRRFMQFSENVQYEIAKKTSTDLISETDKFLTSLTTQGTSDIVSASDLFTDTVQHIEDTKNGKFKAVETGIKFLDDKINGFYGGRLYILAGRPAMGKTALALTMAINQSEATPTLFISLEMPKIELMQRLLASKAGVPMSRQQSKENLTQDEWSKLTLAREKIKKHNLFILDSHCSDLHSIKALCRRFRRAKGKCVIFIDYLGLIQMDKKISSKVHQIEDITTNLKSLAKELDSPIVLLSQLSRSVEGRDNKRPMLSDLRDSGAIEQDADMVMFVYREEYYLERNEDENDTKTPSHKIIQKQQENLAKLERVRGKAEVIVAKYRQGTTGSVLLNFEGEKQKFS